MSKSIIEVLTMDEIEQINLLTGISFEESFSKGIKLGKATMVLCWVLSKRVTPASTLEDFGSFTVTQVNDYLQGFLTDPKATPEPTI